MLAMIREFEEEAGVLTSPGDWEHVLTLRFTYAEVEIFAGRNEIAYLQAKTQTDERIMKHHTHEVERCDVVENIPSLLLLSLQRISLKEGVASTGWAARQEKL